MSQAQVGPDRPPSVKMFGIIALVLVVLFVIMMVTGGGRHGPDRHIPSSDSGGHTLPSRVTGSGVQQPLA